MTIIWRNFWSFTEKSVVLPAEKWQHTSPTGERRELCWQAVVKNERMFIQSCIHSYSLQLAWNQGDVKKDPSPYLWVYATSDTHLFVGGWFIILVPRHRKRKINTIAGQHMVTISSCHSLPWSLYSHCTNTATLLTPTITSSSPSYPRKKTNSTSHLGSGVQFRLSPMVTSFPRAVYFHSAAVGLFSASVSTSPGLLPRPSGRAQRCLWVEVAEIWGLKMLLL